MDDVLKAKILVIDDEPAARLGMRKALQLSKYIVEEAENGLVGLEKINQFNPDVVLCDINMPKMNGLEFLKTLKETIANPPLTIVVTAYGTEKVAVQAMKSGAYDYLTKPFEKDELLLTIKKAIEKQQLRRENLELKQKLFDLTSSDIIGKSPAIKKVTDLIQKVAPTDVTVLITGESGTGKELVSKTIHNQSSRANGPFITMNCAAIPRDLVESELFGNEKGAFTGATSQRQGKFEIADGGTLFLDEIADMSLETQAKILRVLEDRSFTRLGGKEIIKTDVRLISATNKNLQQEIAAGNFRQDLYYRLKVVEITLPPLVERREDIPLLAEAFVKVFVSKHGKQQLEFEAGALKRLSDYDWPGNVRQLLHVVEQCVVLADSIYIQEQNLPEEIFDSNLSLTHGMSIGTGSFKDEKGKAVNAIELQIITKALEESAGNVSRAARKLDMKRQFLQQKIKKLGIDTWKFKNRVDRNDQ